MLTRMHVTIAALLLVFSAILSPAQTKRGIATGLAGRQMGRV
jgi:hypothetical protein